MLDEHSVLDEHLAEKPGDQLAGASSYRQEFIEI